MQVIKTIQYRGFEITVKSYPSRFGTTFTATNNYGEPYENILFFGEMEDAVNWDKNNLDQCLDQ